MILNKQVREDKVLVFSYFGERYCDISFLSCRRDESDIRYKAGKVIRP